MLFFILTRRQKKSKCISFFILTSEHQTLIFTAAFFRQVKNNNLKLVDVNLFIAYDKLFDSLMLVPPNEGAGIADSQPSVPLDQIIILGGVVLIDLEQVKTKFRFALIRNQVEAPIFLVEINILDVFHLVELI